MGEVVNQEDIENEIQQKMVSVEFETDDENECMRALPKIAFSSASLRETLGYLLRGRNSLRIEQDASGRAITQEVPIYPLPGNRIKTNYKVYEITPEIHKALSPTGYTGKNMKDDSDILSLHNNLRGIKCTGDGIRASKT